MTKTITGYGYNGTSSSFWAYPDDLTASTTYYAKGYVVVNGVTTYGNTISFTTSASGGSTQTPAVDEAWLELPAAAGSQYDVVKVSYNGERNYTHLYDKDNYLSLWTAYPLNSSHMGSGRSDDWSYNPYIDQKYQADLTSKSYATGDNGSSYSRGHMIPNSSRNGISGMQSQTFYVTNSVPQIQDGFNGGIWNNLEQAVQSIAEKEEIYVVTGVALNKVGENRTVYHVSPKSNASQKCAIPNYFYKVVLKVNKSGSTVTGAKAIGFWFENKAYTDSYTNYSVSVDQVEAWTGFDFFVNLPDNLEAAAETNTSWDTFKNF